MSNDEQYTLQEYYDELVSRAKDGRFPARDENGGCRYRTKDGKKCAAGLLIPDDKYRSNMEGCGVEDNKIFDACTLMPKELTEDNLLNIQIAHDESSSFNTTQDFAKQFINRINDLECFNSVKKD